MELTLCRHIQTFKYTIHICCGMCYVYGFEWYVSSLPHERYGTTWAVDPIGLNLVELPELVTWP